MKLKEITFREAPRLPGIRPGAISSLECFNPHPSLVGWRALLRGASIFFVSPSGYRVGVNPNEWDKKGPIIIHEVPRSQCYLAWVGSPDEIAGVQKFDTPPYGPEAVGEEKSAVPATDKKPGGLLDQVL